MMTNIFRLGKTIFVVAFLSMITSCGDFLEEKSQDLFIPKTVQDYKEFVYFWKKFYFILTIMESN